VAKFLSGLDISLGNLVQRQILRGDTVPPLATTRSRVRCVAISDSSSGATYSGVQSSVIVARTCGEVEDVDIVVATFQGEDANTEIRVHVTVFTMVGTIITLTSSRTSVVSLRGLRLLLLLLLQLPPPLLLSYKHTDRRFSLPSHLSL